MQRTLDLQRPTVVTRPRTGGMALVQTQLPLHRCSRFHQLPRNLRQLLFVLWDKPIGQAQVQPILQPQCVDPAGRVCPRRKIRNQALEPRRLQLKTVPLLARCQGANAYHRLWLVGLCVQQRAFQRTAIPGNSGRRIVKKSGERAVGHVVVGRVVAAFVQALCKIGVELMRQRSHGTGINDEFGKHGFLCECLGGLISGFGCDGHRLRASYYIICHT